ncbi:MAG: hypothetical protein AB1793_02275 [Candidatus Thermoplasmatota archaeon]
MTAKVDRPRPAAVKALVATMAFFSFVGLMTGYGLLSDPTGAGIGLSQDLLEDAPVGDFTMVGLFFVAFFGILPALAAYGLWMTPRWGWTDAVNRWTGQNWAWTATAALGVILLLWIAVEVVFVGALTGIGGAMQVTIAVLGVAVLALVTRPSVKSYARLEG